MSDSSYEILLRLPDVRRRVGLSRQTIYRLMRQGAFPAAVLLTSRSVAWRAADVEEWIQNRPQHGGA